MVITSTHQQSISYYLLITYHSGCLVVVVICLLCVIRKIPFFYCDDNTHIYQWIIRCFDTSSQCSQRQVCLEAQKIFVFSFILSLVFYFNTIIIIIIIHFSRQWEICQKFVWNAFLGLLVFVCHHSLKVFPCSFLA